MTADEVVEGRCASATAEVAYDETIAAVRFVADAVLKM